jgi:hypothetical protein
MVRFEHPILSGVYLVTTWCGMFRRAPSNRAAAVDDYDAVLKTFRRASNISGNGRFGPNGERPGDEPGLCLSYFCCWLFALA